MLFVLFAMVIIPNMAWGQWDTKTFIFNGATDDILYAVDSNDETMNYSWNFHIDGHYCAGLVESKVKISVEDNYGKGVLTPPDNFTIKKVTLNYSNLDVTEGSKIYVRAVNRTDTTTHYTDPYLMTSDGTLDINLNDEGILSDNLCFLIFSDNDKAYSYILNSITITKIADYHLSIGGVSLTGSNVDPETGAVTGLTGVYFTPANNTVSPATPATLTLNNATITRSVDENGILYSGTEALIIKLKGSNTISCSGEGIAILCNVATAPPTLTIAKGDENPCSLVLEAGTDGGTINGFTVSSGGLYSYVDNTEEVLTTTYTTLGGGSGESAEYPIIIKTAEDLRDFAKLVNKGTITNEYIKLNPEGGELDCNGLTGFEPIGTGDLPFIGKFDGNNCTIKNLTYSTDGTGDYVGLFGIVGNEGVSDAKIEKLTLSNCSFNGGGCVGGIVGELKNGTIENCVLSSCTVKGGDAFNLYVGGIAGQVKNGTISTCAFNSGLVDGSTAYSGAPSTAYAGGIVGCINTANSVTVSSCTVSSTNVKSVTSGSDGAYDIYVGGLVGRSLGTVAISDNKITNTDNTKKISCQNINGTFTTYHCGAIIGEKGDETTLTNNTYEYDVTTDIAGTTKSGYTQRGIGGTTYNTTTQQNEPNPDVFTNNGAVMFTKLLTLPEESAEGYVLPELELGNGFYDYASDDYGILVAPGQPVKLMVLPSISDGYSVSAVSVNYGTDQTAEITLTKTEDGKQFYTITEMPDADATLNVTFTKSYDLWIGDTQVTSENAAHILGENNETVSFTSVFDENTEVTTNTLTLNGAVLTAPVKVGLDNLTIDIQGTNTITTSETCIQKMENTTPAVTFKSTSDVVGSLTLKGAAGVNDIGVDHKGSFSISDELALVLKKNDKIYSDQYWFTDGSTIEAKLSPSYGVTVGGMQICPDNAADVIGDGINSGMVSFDKDNSILTLNNASLSGIIRSSLPNLKIELVGDNSIYSGGDRILQAGVAVNMTIQSSAAEKGSLSMHKGFSSSEKGNFVDDNVTLTISAPLAVLSGSLEDNSESNDYYATIGVSYGLTVAGVTVSNVNASNVLGGATATVVFTPADNTTSPATPATLTLNGEANLGTISSGLENLKIVINGENAAVGVSANSAVSGDKNITFEGGTNGGTLAISAGDGGSVVSGFASVSYVGAYAAADIPFGYDKTASQQGYRKSHMMDDNSYLETLTITTVPHYPIWLYTNVTTSTQINNTNKNTLLDASGNVSFDGNNTLSLKNGVNCEARIVSGLSELTISIDGDCIIESPDSGSVVRSINSSAPLTIEKASGASSATLKLATGSHTAINAFASLDYTGLILLSEGATYTSGALNDSNNQPLNEAIFTTGLKKPTLQMNYETDTYSFQNPNGGGTLKYSRYFANNEYPDEKNQVDNGSTTFLIFKNGRQYNDPLTVICEVWVEANGNSSEKLYACRLDVKDMTTTYGGTVPTPEILPKAIEGVTVSGYSLGDHTEVAATVTEGNITLTGAGRQELDAIFSIPDGVEYIKTSTTETPKATFFLDVKPATPILSKATGSYAGTQTITVTNLTPNATAMYYTYEGEEPENPNAQAFPEGGVDISSSKTLAVYYRAEYETETSMEYLYSETTKVAYTILADPELKYMQGTTEVTTAEWTLGKDDNTALPVLQNTHSVAVTYESSNTDVATVATDGTVTAVGIGTATITATSAATSEYAAGEASYTLTVNRQLNVSFSASNTWATYCGTENLAMPEGLKAYQVTAVEGATVTISEIGYIPANTAVLLQNVSNNNVWTNIAASAYTGATSTFENNKLIGTASAVDVSTITGGTVYILVNNMFRRSTSGSIPANRGYLVVATSSNAPQLSISIGDENTTAISNTDFTDNTDKAGEWYSIDGVKLNGQPQKPGLYIKNGKKVFINKK